MPDRHDNGELQVGDCLQKVSTQTEIALAVSGGPDSMALLLLVDRWRRERLAEGLEAPDLVVLTVDHGLRKESAKECQLVVKQAKALGYTAEILPWSGEKPETRVQEMAREMRYQLLASACHMRGIRMLLTGHHLDDQAETFLMRLARGSGVDGLSAMAVESRRYGLHLVRPLLEIEKSALVDLLEEAGWDWVSDPGNLDSRYERGRLRQRHRELAKLGLSAKMTGLAASRLRRARTALNEICNRFLAENALISDFGTARMDQLAFHDAPDEIALRALSKLLRQCGGVRDFTSMARLETLVQRLKSDFSTNRTLAGCRIIASGDFWLIVREPGRITERNKPVVPDDCMFWDNRYIVCAGKKATKNIHAGPLVKSTDLEVLAGHEGLQKIPKQALESLLVLRLRGRLIAVPAIDYWQPEAIHAGLRAKLVTGDDGLL